MMQKAILLLIIALLTASTGMADPPFYFGGDISALPELEKLGAIYRDHDQPTDAITLLRNRNANLFRVRLFVDPGHNFDKTIGATQDLPMVLALARRIKQSGADFSLAIHYSDTWADPATQTKPVAWKDLSLDQLTQKVTDYTVSVLQAMKANQTPPDIVEVGNETTNGMLWPEGKVGGHLPPEEESHQWANYARLLKAGTTAVRSQLPTARILVHINAGGKAGKPLWFFNHLQSSKPDFDIIGLSFYPTWGDSLEGLKKNLTDLAPLGKDILIIETAYPYRSIKPTPQTIWPMTPEGQNQFLTDVIDTVKAAPGHRGIGVIWWYPEAQPIAHHGIWSGGAMGLLH